MKTSKKEIAREKAKLRAFQVKSTGAGSHNEDKRSEKRKTRRKFKQQLRKGDVE